MIVPKKYIKMITKQILNKHRVPKKYWKIFKDKIITQKRNRCKFYATVIAKFQQTSLKKHQKLV